jgi:hypothetical protein
MKKELLMASALVSTMGVASVAEAVTATMSGGHDAGVVGSNVDSGTNDTTAAKTESNFTVSLSETTDGGVGISTSFMLANEGNAGGTHTSGLTLTFTDGSKLDLVNAGNAAGSHDISVPGGAGKAEGISVVTTNTAQTGLDFFKEAGAASFEWHSAADFLADGLKVGVSYSADNGAAAAASTKLVSSWGLGATYVTTAGDTSVTVGAGLSDSSWRHDGAQPSANSNGMHVGFSAVTGDLTVAAGYADGDKVSGGTGEFENVDATVTQVGVKYVAGDLTLSAGFTTGEGKDSDTMGTRGTTIDSKDVTEAGVSYAVASGVTANIGWKDISAKDEGSSDNTGGTSWYVGASMSF